MVSYLSTVIKTRIHLYYAPMNDMNELIQCCFNINKRTCKFVFKFMFFQLLERKKKKRKQIIGKIINKTPPDLQNTKN